MPRSSARIRSFSSRSATRNMSTSAIRSPVFGSTASGRSPLWKQKSFPWTWYEGRPSSETSFVACGMANASASRSAMVAMRLLCQRTSDRGDDLRAVRIVVERTNRVPDRPHHEPEGDRCPGEEHDQDIPTDPGAQQDRESKGTAGEQVDTPDDRLDAVDVLELRCLAERGWKRVPGAGERAGERALDGNRAEKGEPPGRIGEHWCRQVGGSAVRDQADHGLHGDETERQANEQPIASSPPLVRVHRERDDGRGHHPGGQARESPAEVERRDRQDALAEVAGEPAPEDRPDRRPAQAVFAVSALSRSICSSHHRAPHSLKSIPQRSTSSTKGGFAPGGTWRSRRAPRIASWNRRRPSS